MLAPLQAFDQRINQTLDMIGNTVIKVGVRMMELMIEAVEIAGKALVATVDKIGEFFSPGRIDMMLNSAAGALGNLNPMKWNLGMGTPAPSPYDSKFEASRAAESPAKSSLIEMPTGRARSERLESSGPKQGGLTPAKMPDTAIAQVKDIGAMLKASNMNFAGLGGPDNNYQRPVTMGQQLFKTHELAKQRQFAMAA